MILVTGGRGFIGSNVVHRLHERGEQVRVLTRYPERAAFPPGVVTVRGDLADGNDLARAVAGVEVVVHLAGLVGSGRRTELMRINADGSGALAAAARDAGVRRFIHCSSAGVYGDGSSSRPFSEQDTPHPGTAYETSKLLAEAKVLEALASSAVGCVILRPSGVYGPDREATVALFREVMRKRVWMHGPARVVVHPTYVADMVAAVELVLDSPRVSGEVFNVAGERVLTYRALIYEIGRRVGRRPTQIGLPSWAASIMAGGGAVARAVGLDAPPWLDRMGRRIVNRSVDTAKIRGLLGFRPVPLAEGLEETFRAMKAGA